MFWIINAILILIAIAFVLPVLLRKSNLVQDGSRDQNIFIAKEQLKELEARFEQGEIDQKVYLSNRDEIEQSLFSDVEGAETTAQERSSAPSLITSILIALLIPVIAISVYLKVGNPTFTTNFDSKQAAAAALKDKVPRNADGTPDIETMVTGLQEKMEKNPDNAKGWYMLGRSYMVLKRYPEATKSFERSLQIKSDSADIMLALADSLAMMNQGDISGRSSDLINKALELEPSNLTALWLGGMAARQKGQYATAVERWRKVLAQISDPNEKKEVESLISEAITKLPEGQKAKLGTKSTTPVARKKPQLNGKGIKLTISLSDKMVAKVNPTDFVFVYAKAMSGPPMPLAAAKIQVKDLPTEIILTDEMAMMPNLKLSSFSEVVVGARVSKSGQPISQNGDLFTEKKSIKLGMKVALVIDSVVVK